jgi:regulator of replication initiation timing
MTLRVKLLTANDKIAEMQHEIVGLRAQLTNADAECNRWMEVNEQLLAENKRLRLELGLSPHAR